METLFVGQKLLRFEELESTNSYLKELTRNQYVAEGLTLVTEYQTLGRGQFGNTWSSESGKNLLFSVYLKPSFLSAGHQFYLNMSVCLALADALNQIAPGFLVKWPNDILYNQKKVAGILIENFLEGDYLEGSILGVGLNVNQRRFQEPNAVALRQIVGREVDRDYLLKMILQRLEANYLVLKQGNVNKLEQAYTSIMYGFNNYVPVRFKGKYCLAKIISIEPSGKLIAEIEGSEQTVNFKEIEFILN